MNLLVVILIQASFYALLGMGYVLIYRATRVLNLAHGDLMVFGAYVFFQTLAASGGNLTLAIVAAAAGAALLGALVYFGVMRPLASYPVAVGVLATIALGLVLRTLVTLIWTAQTRYPAQFVGQLGGPIPLLPGVTISAIDLMIVAASIIAMIGFPVLLRLSTVGIEMRGVAENAVLAAQRGINIHRINALSWAAAAMMAAVAGMFFSIKVRLGPDIWYVGLAGFAPALIGGMDSLRGVVIGAVIVAAAEVLAALFIAPQVAMAAPFLVLLVALWIRPWGIFGSREQLERI
ncbi:MAG: branched-chain amino acid ABC transporter permease [Xanthobacteraceae bacterium]|nr:branched-chain amino acid ABC transporter permease [Xanthobacteraceae bacterium]